MSLHAILKGFRRIQYSTRITWLVNTQGLEWRTTREFACSYISLQAGPWACMQFHELVCSSFLCLSSSQELRSACYNHQSIPHIIWLYGFEKILFQMWVFFNVCFFVGIIWITVQWRVNERIRMVVGVIQSCFLRSKIVVAPVWTGVNCRCRSSVTRNNTIAAWKV